MDNDNTSASSEDDAKPNYAKEYWLVRNKGVIRQLAREFGRSPAFVHNIFHHKRSSRNRVIEARLMELGAPGFLTVEAAQRESGIKPRRWSTVSAS